MDEKDFEIILSLFELKNITKTSEKLFMTQPALTSRIKKIEEDLGAPILLRSKKGVIFTPIGESIIPYMRDMTANMRQMRDHVCINHDSVEGTLRIGASVNFARYKLPQYLKKYLHDFPKVDVNILTEKSVTLHKLIQRNEISVAVLRGEFKWDEGKKRLSTEPICLVSQEKLSREQLRDTLYIGHKSDSVLQGQINDWYRNNIGSEEKAKIWVDSIDACLALVRNGIGWAILPEICLEKFTGYRENLYFADGSPFVRNTYIFYKHAYIDLPQVDLFIRYLMDMEIDSVDA